MLKVWCSEDISYYWTELIEALLSVLEKHDKVNLPSEQLTFTKMWLITIIADSACKIKQNTFLFITLNNCVLTIIYFILVSIIKH